MINNNEYEEHLISDDELNKGYTDYPVEVQWEMTRLWPYETDFDDDTPTDSGLVPFADNPEGNIPYTHGDWREKTDF